MAIEKELTYLDLVVLQKVVPETYLEKFGHKINTSFFDTANLIGALKIKGYLDIRSSLGGQSEIWLTDEGKNVLKAAELRAGEELDKLDEALLNIIGEGVKEASQIAAELNVRQSDLAVHLHKLVAKGLADFNLRSARVELQLTEKGFSTLGHRPRPRRPAEDIGAELTAGKGMTAGPQMPVAVAAHAEMEVPASAAEMHTAMVARPGGPDMGAPVKQGGHESRATTRSVITGRMRLNARIQYWRQRYGLMAIAALILVLAAVAYFFLLK